MFVLLTSGGKASKVGTTLAIPRFIANSTLFPHLFFQDSIRVSGVVLVIIVSSTSFCFAKSSCCSGGNNAGLNSGGADGADGCTFALSIISLIF